MTSPTKPAKQQMSYDDVEFRIELLKERIYATLALLAVLFSINSEHSTVGRAALIVAGTAFSLWLASLVASKMSYRIIMQKPRDEQQASRSIASHAPLLLSAVFPLLSLGLARIGILTLAEALNLAIALSVFLMVTWSLLSAKAVHAKRLSTFVIALIELAVGLAIVVLKLKVSH